MDKFYFPLNETIFLNFKNMKEAKQEICTIINNPLIFLQKETF